jgi:hypothetical protein
MSRISGITGTSNQSFAIDSDGYNIKLSVENNEIVIRDNSNIKQSIATTSGGTGQTTYAVGDILYSNATDSLVKRTIGSTGQVLTVTGGIPIWADSSGGAITPQPIADTNTQILWEMNSTSIYEPNIGTLGGDNSYRLIIMGSNYIRQSPSVHGDFTVFGNGDYAHNSANLLPGQMIGGAAEPFSIHIIFEPTVATILSGANLFSRPCGVWDVGFHALATQCIGIWATPTSINAVVRTNGEGVVAITRPLSFGLNLITLTFSGNSNSIQLIHNGIATGSLSLGTTGWTPYTAGGATSETIIGGHPITGGSTIGNATGTFSHIMIENILRTPEYCIAAYKALIGAA